MTAQEQQMLQGLTDRVNQTKLQEKDADAEHLLQSALSRNPDAIYILAQTVLVQQYALEQAQKQLAQLREQQQQQVEQPKHSTSFLGNLLHLNDEPSRPASPPPPLQASQSQYAPVQNYNQPPLQSSSIFGGGAQPGQSGGFLRSAMQTAAGVAAGALAFQGIESLMHGFSGGGGGFGGGSGLGSFGGNSGRPEEVVNNYYGDSGTQGRGGDLADRLSPDVEDRRDDTNSSSFADTSNDNSSSLDDESSSDDNSIFDSGGDDSGGDDSGSGDNSF